MSIRTKRISFIMAIVMLSVLSLTVAFAAVQTWAVKDSDGNPYTCYLKVTYNTVLGIKTSKEATGILVRSFDDGMTATLYTELYSYNGSKIVDKDLTSSQATRVESTLSKVNKSYTIFCHYFSGWGLDKTYSEADL